MFTLKGGSSEGAGPGLIRLVGSFTTDSNNKILNQRPSKSNVTITRKATGVYTLAYSQATLSVVSSRVQLGQATNIGTASVPTSVIGEVMISADFMTTNAGGTAFAADTTNTTLVVLCFAAASNPTSLTAADVYTLGNTSSLPNYRICYDIVLATSTMNQ